MKIFLLILILAPLLGRGQKLALLDRHFQQPFSIADTITVDDVAKGALPVYFQDVPSIVNALQSILKYLGNGKINKKEIFHLKTGESKCVVLTDLIGKTNRYNIVLNTKTFDFKTSLVIVSQEANKKASQRVSMFIDYLRNNTSAMEKR